MCIALIFDGSDTFAVTRDHACPSYMKDITMSKQLIEKFIDKLKTNTYFFLLVAYIHVYQNRANCYKQ